MCTCSVSSPAEIGGGAPGAAGARIIATFGIGGL